MGIEKAEKATLKKIIMDFTRSAQEGRRQNLAKIID